jgi:hypothetical protein
MILVALALGTGGAIACFYFALWLSNQIFECPDWALWCTVRPSVFLILDNFQLAQGIVSTLYGICISAIAYATYKLAQTAVWALLARRAFTFGAIDDYIAATQGSIPSAPAAIMQVRTVQHLLVLGIVVSVSVLLKVDSIIVGHALSLTDVPTILYSNQTLGGGTGIQFLQTQPASRLPGAAAGAYLNYLAWAQGYETEPMPEYRNFLVDRRTLAKLGQVSVNAMEATTSISCYGFPINFTGEIVVPYNEDLQWEVNTNFSGLLNIRLQPYLSVWVDAVDQVNTTSATTRLVFAAIKGTIEGGYNNIAPAGSDMATKSFVNSIATLACDVEVSLSDSYLCTALSPETCGSPNVTLTSSSNLVPHAPGGLLTNAIWLGAAIETYGINVAAAQPLFDHGPPIQNDNLSISLPVPYTSSLGDIKDASPQWSLKQLTDFIEVGSGAYAQAMSQAHWPNGTSVLESVYSSKRMSTNRVYLLLLPPALAVGSVLLLSLLVVAMHATTKVPYFRLGDSSSFVVSSQTSEQWLTMPNRPL